MSFFETNPKPLKLLLTQIHNGELALPDFQRDFVWDPSAIEELIESIMRNYPAGSLLFLKHGGDGFQVREFEGAPILKSQMGTSYLVLDGQQRMTSLYQAFYGKGEHRFFLDIKELMESDDIEAAVWHESEKRCQRQGLLKIETQAEKLICPLQVVMGEGFDSWIDSIMDIRAEKGDSAKELRTQLRQVSKELVQPILDYQFPVITLGDNTPLDAVCKMFETLNRRGVKLTVFELLMARSFANKVSLRQLWDSTLEENQILEQFEIDPYYVLQIVNLLNGGSIKRKDILDMETGIVSKYWSKATTALTDSVEFLRKNCGVLAPNLLPYNTMLVPMAAVWAKTSDIKGPQETVRRDKITQWFWSSVFAQVYEKGPTSRAVSDYKELESWIRGGEKEPYSIRVLHFNPDMFHEITPKQRALYRGTLALITSNGALDFHKSEKLTFDYLVKNKVDDHHIFPQNFMKKSPDKAKVNCVLNRTLIDRKTNIRISDKAPSLYLEEIENEIGKKALIEVLQSHLINIEHLESDDFETFMKDRAKSLMEELKRKMKKEIPATPVAFVAEDSEVDDEDDEKSNPREKYDPSLINVSPKELLADLPQEIEELFSAFSEKLLLSCPNVWWRSTSRKVVFWSPERLFATCRISRSGLHFVIFTNDKPLDGVDPIIQKDNGGKLWGRIKLKHIADVDKIMKSIAESHTRLESAVKNGTSTGWWAMSKKQNN